MRKNIGREFVGTSTAVEKVSVLAKLSLRGKSSLTKAGTVGLELSRQNLTYIPCTVRLGINQYNHEHVKTKQSFCWLCTLLTHSSNEGAAVRTTFRINHRSTEL